MNPTRFGNVMAAVAFLLWGAMPLYYQFLPNAAMDELLALRILASLPFLLLVLQVRKATSPNWSALVADKRSFFFAGLASVMMCISWSAFTWAMTNDRVLDASLGYFINPLLVIALGVVAFNETLTLGQKAAVLFGALGLSYQIWQYGELPVAALLMAVFFALYGWCKRHVKYDAISSLLVETIALLPVAAIYMAYKIGIGTSVAVSGDMSTLLLYLGAAPVTLLPLFFFSEAVKYAQMSMIGFMQYIEPSLQFVLAIAVFGEAFDGVKTVSFGLIWLGLAISIIESLVKVKPKPDLPQH
ncbi:EamA family transporter RarD [Grimontia hollisae]|uniref:Predicted permease n=2 Tax=Grimontia hollisae TaxID=673 RepID=D0I9F7_GRIHO|nr:EamA family transporter RarD [Grimontia hollisae]AMG29372.1 EamA family transporter RarD [Grimontia hollisae]EEY72072.1 predicted permease [Grimontia hollisae CIP 101886]MDF2184005.1 EamA family transporter RarD [Grimontia hollisae]STO77621.1 putative chloramphenical resistance permease RarD [Grimontia hollisae]STO98578.1 putative chloramphenical resistance permease RarD [Grimontia hollisae]